MTGNEFAGKRRTALLSLKEKRPDVRTFLLRSIDEDGQLYLAYKHLSKDDAVKLEVKSLEVDLEDCLDVFRDGTLLKEHYWRKLRRFALKRYSFGLLWKIYRKWKPSPWTVVLPFVLDVAMLRIPLAMLLAYGSLLGAGNLISWISYFGKKDDTHLIGGAAICLASSAYLLYLNIHDKLGRIENTELKSVWRTLPVLGISVLWCSAWNVAISRLGEQIKVPKTSIDGAFDPGLILVTAVALVFAILGQFFFTGDRSIAEPL